MNRREVLSSMFGAAAASVVPEGAKADVVVKDDEALLLVVTMPDDMCHPSEVDVDRIKGTIRNAIGEKCPPVLILMPGMSIRLVRNGAYTFREKLGDYEHEYTFKTMDEMTGFVKELKRPQKEEAIVCDSTTRNGPFYEIRSRKDS